MNDLNAAAKPSRCPEQLYVSARFELVYLRLAEVKETNGQYAGTVFNLDQQSASAAHCDGRAADGALDDRIDLIAQSGDGREVCSVLIAEWKVEQ